MTGQDALAKTTNWSNAVLVYDDGEVSYIWGTYRGSTGKQLGMRWNISEGVNQNGYPSYNGHPNWLVLPDYVYAPILTAILKLIASDKAMSDSGKSAETKTVMAVLEEALNQEAEIGR